MRHSLIEAILKKSLGWARAGEPRTFATLLDIQYQQFIFNIIGATVVPILFLLIIDGATSNLWVWAWFLAQMALEAVHFFQRRAFLRTPAKERDYPAWYQRALVIMVFSGLLWGLTPFAFFQIEQTTSPLIFAATTAMLLSGGLALVHLPLGYIVFSICSMPLLAISMFWLSDSWNLLATMIFFYMTMMVNFSIGTNQSVADSIRIQFENEDLAKELEAANQAKSRLLATASHDLRQPLQALSLLTSASIDAGKADKRTLSSMQRSLGNLNALFDSLLDISKLDSGVVKVDMQAFDLSDLLQALQDEFSNSANLKGLSLIVEQANSSKCWVEADPVLTRRVLSNLVNNAINNTEKGAITIKTEIESASVRVSINDTGKGIEAEQLTKIFNEFYQIEGPKNSSEDRSKKQKGMGLGLSIVEKLVKLQHQTIDVSSKPGVGSVFSLHLKASQSLEALTPKPSEPRTNDSNKEHQILIIDDEKDINQAMQLQLETWGYRVLVAKDSQQAFKYLGTLEQPIDLIISDYHLNDKYTGLEVIRQIQTKLGKDISSLVITGDTKPERIQELKASDSMMLYKPVLAEPLRIAVEHLLNSE